MSDATRNIAARTRAATFALLFLVTSASTLAAQESGPTTVPAFRDAFVDAVARWDVDAWSQLVAEDVVMMAPNGRVVEGRDAFHELWTRTFEGRSGRNPLQVQIREFTIEDDLAVVRADYGPEGADPVGQYVWTLRRVDGSWLLDWWIFNRRSGDPG